MLDGIDSGGESDVGSILNDSHTQFVSNKPISKKVHNTHDILVPEARVVLKCICEIADFFHYFLNPLPLSSLADLNSPP